MIHPFSRNTPSDKSKCPVSFDDVVEIFNQLGIYLAVHYWKKNFWDTEKFLKDTRPNYVKWQGAWKNRIKHYTPRTKPAYDDVPVDGLIEKWNPKLARSVSQIKTIPISPMFGPEIVALYKLANEKHPACTVVKSLPPRRWTQVTSLSGTRSMCFPYH